MFRIVLLCALGVVGTTIAAAEGASAQSNDAALRIEAKIPLGDVRGRIDHMAADIDRRRLFVAELGNNSVGIVDVGQAKVLLQVLGGQKEPQGIGYLPSTDTLYVANGGDGSLRLFQRQMVGSISEMMRTMCVWIDQVSMWWSATVMVHWH